MDWDIVVSEFKFYLSYQIPFWANTLKKGMNLSLLDMGWLIPLLFICKDGFGIK